MNRGFLVIGLGALLLLWGQNIGACEKGEQLKYAI